MRAITRLIHSRVSSLALLLAAASLAAAPLAHSADYYVDPATGNMSNSGSSASPWSTLAEVFAANKTFVAGDNIYLRDGYHGAPTIKGKPAGTVTIQPQAGHSPTVHYIIFDNARYWHVKGLDISPVNAGIVSKTALVNIKSNSPDITLEDCDLYFATSCVGWTATDWTTTVGTGITSEGPRTKIIGNRLEQVNFGININLFAPDSLVSRNTITNFMSDGIRALSSGSTYEYNLIQNCYAIDSNHDDGIQSWTGGRGTDPVGTLIVSNVTIRGNVIISWTDPNQPFKSQMQGIGCFDGFFEYWTIENNIIVTDMWQGLALYGARYCKVVNNTVMPNPINGFSYTPWIKITNHKNGTPSTDNLVRNNLTWAITNAAGIGTVDNNIVSTSPTSHFVDWNNFDLRLLPTSTAVDAGSATDTPTIDFEEHDRDSTPDIGADEYTVAAMAYEPFDYATTTNISAAPDSASDFGFNGTTWGSSCDVVAPGLTYSGLGTLGNALSFFSNIGVGRTIDMSQVPTEYVVVGGDSIPRFGKAGSQVWMSFLLKPVGTDSDGTQVAGINLNGATSGGTTKLSIGDVGTTTTWSLKKPSSTIGASGTSIVTGDTVLLVVSIKFVSGSNNDEVDLYVNPTLGANPPGTPSATLRNMDIGAFNRIEWKGNRTSIGDEFTLGGSWSAVIGN